MAEKRSQPHKLKFFSGNSHKLSCASIVLEYSYRHLGARNKVLKKSFIEEVLLWDI